MRTVIRNGYVIAPSNDFEGFADVSIVDGVIEMVGDVEGVSIDEEIDATGLVVAPGFVDIHAHLRDPGFTYKETIETGMRAAVKGGFTAICCMPNTNPTIDNIQTVEYIKSKAANVGICDVYPIGTITKGEKGEELTDMMSLKEAGCVAFSDDGRPVMNAEVLRKALIYAEDLNVPLTLHEEDLNISGDGVVNEGKIAFELGLKGIPNVSESSIIARDVEIAKSTNTHLHICHVSTKESIDVLKKAKMDSGRITFEVTPHHLSLTDEEIKDYNTFAKVNPPLRSKEDVKAVHGAFSLGLVDAIATDHAPHDEDSKRCTIQNAAFGISGFETAFAVVNTYLVETGVVSLADAIALMTVKPARIFHLDTGTLNEGSSANIVLIDKNREWVVDRNKFVSKGKNTPYHDKKLKGAIVKTFYKGMIVYSEEV
ncbi:dihydroorotase [Hippea maritima]|uniref:Dihydroorotase n=1 Tax=Hippea maritima (strain ATCC 700847 / DSM 10411 / MH2) TaxID=760142 RepID=F2LUG2_HIPMA|nr:dihydroorotase [Hippea maritima]AEA33488.1 dihydroorotase, multifunctional complex type [Hippea maritima DSM 10411]